MSLFLFGTFSIFQVHAESIVPDGIEHVDSFGVDMLVNTDSSISVTETINYDFDKNVKSGWTRYIPLNYQDLNGANISIAISNLTVTDENNNPYIFKQSYFQSDDKKKNYLAITIGDESQTVSEIKTYIIHYAVSGAIKFSADHDELLWNMTGDKWPVYVKYPEITITLPQKVDNDQIKKECFIGLHAATIQCIDRLGGKRSLEADYSYKGVVSGEAMTTIIDFPKNIVQKKIVVSQTFWNKLKTELKLQLIVFSVALVFFVLIFLIIKYFKKITDSSFCKTILSFFIWLGKKIKLHHVHAHAKKHAKKLKNKSRKWWITLGVFLGIVVFLGVLIFWKIDATFNKISTRGESVGSIVQAGIPNAGQVKGESDDRINILLLGVLGANHQGGGLNTDTIMIVSLEPKANKISMVSLPRDLWVLDPGKETKSKINAVYEYGEEKGTGKGIVDMENLIGEITGLTIHYTAVVSTQGFTQLVDTLGGVDVSLTKPFDESAQFADVNVCDSNIYTVPTGEFQIKKDKKGRVAAQYPLCKNITPECGGDFHLPVGKNTLNGQQALCFVRSRYLTSDFERAKRQQLILQQIKQKAVQIDLSSFAKVNAILDNLGNNMQTDMQLWEMRHIFDLYNGMHNPRIYQKVLEDSKQGLLYSPDATPATGYILLPRGDNYDQIRNLFQNIFNSSDQLDIKPKI